MVSVYVIETARMLRASGLLCVAAAPYKGYAIAPHIYSHTFKE